MSDLSDCAVEALADFLVERDWPSATPRERHVLHNPEYKRMAAAILNGEGWALRKAWPEGAMEIISTRSA